MIPRVADRVRRYRSILRGLFIAVVVAAAVTCVFGVRRGARTDLFSLLGSLSPELTALADSQANRIRILCADTNRAQQCRALVASLPSREPVPSIRLDEPLAPERMLELVRTRGDGLLSAKSRELLLANETNRIAKSALRRDYSGLGLFPKADDPYYFLNDFVLELGQFRPQLPEGAVLLTGTTNPSSPDPSSPDPSSPAPSSPAPSCPDPLSALIELSERDEGISLSGSPFHSYLTTEATKREINVLGGVSLIAVLVIGFCLFRSFRFILPTLAALGSGFLIGSAALFVFHPRPHVLTFLFGTSLIGLGVDYCYHALKARTASAADERDSGNSGSADQLAAGGAELSRLAAFHRNLTCALITTCCAFLPLVFSSVAILREMAVFTLFGLLAVYSFVRLWK